MQSKTYTYNSWLENIPRRISLHNLFAYPFHEPTKSLHPTKSACTVILYFFFFYFISLTFLAIFCLSCGAAAYARCTYMDIYLYINSYLCVHVAHTRITYIYGIYTYALAQHIIFRQCGSWWSGHPQCPAVCLGAYTDRAMCS